jgi:di/tricarboxylate transporter
MVVGGGIVATILILVSVKVLSSMLHHVGGMPWVGDQLADAITWILAAIDQKKGG